MIIFGIIGWGLLVGWIATMILGGPEHERDWGPMILAGLAGSFVGGLLVSLLSGDGLALRPSGLIGSVLGAVIVIAVLRSLQHRHAH